MVAAAGACRDSAPARIGFGAPWLGRDLAEVARQTIAERYGPRVVEVPESLMVSFHLPREYAGEIAYASRMAAVPGLAGMVGPQSSRATLLVARIYADAGIPLIAPTATSSQLKHLEPPVFQLAADEVAEGEFIAGFLSAQLHARRVSVFYLAADEYGISLRDGVVAALQRHGLELVDEVPIMVQSDFDRRVAMSLARGVPDAVVVAARGPELAAIAVALHRRRPGLPTIGGDGTIGAEIHLGGHRDSAVYSVGWWLGSPADPRSRAFIERFTRVARHAPFESDAMTFDALMVLAEAVHESGGRPAAVRRYLASLGRGRPPYDGVTGPISFAPGRHENLLMLGIRGDSTVIVYRDGPR